MVKNDPESIPLRLFSSQLAMPKLNGFARSGSKKGSPSPSENVEEQKIEIPPDIQLYTNQVAGHGHEGKSYGLLKQDDKVLKPLMEPTKGEREISFYEELEKTGDDVLLELKEFVPKYFGTKMVSINGKNVQCIVLEDLIKNFKDPCIMDVKIGRRCWDPSASYEKVIRENEKYHESRRDLGFCIPGFQVYKISNGRLCRYGKDYGKKLNKDTTQDALKIFLNVQSGLSRHLLLQFLVNLWKILHWARRQRKYRIYSSSLLLIYDAKRLKQQLISDSESQSSLHPLPSFPKTTCLYKPLSLMKINGNEGIPTGFSGQISKDGPIFSLSRNPSKVINGFNLPPPKALNPDHPWEKSIQTLKRVHSFKNNFDHDLQSMKKEYFDMLDDLVNDNKNQEWATIKMIDFAHVFPAESGQIDQNYLDGLENLIKIFEEFLTKTENE